jgi:tetratricopeptide (TPR) repeat protein
MRYLPTLLLLSFVVWGCSPKSPTADDESSKIAASRAFKIVESQETREQKQIEVQSAALFTNGGFGELDALAAKYRASKEANADGSWKLRYVYEGLEPGDDATLGEWKNRVTRADEWIRTNPNSITARVAKARLLIGYGWAVRGSEYADAVKDKQWTQFFELLQQATKVLHDDELSERCPVYWSTWQRAALGLQMERADYDDIFRRAVKEFPDYWYYYYTRVIFLLPRWYGEPGDWEKDLTGSADGVGGESGDMLYARVVCYVHNYAGGIDVFEENRISWERVERGLEGLLKRFPNSISLKNERAFLAALAGDKEKARAYFAEIKDECDLSVWHEKQKIEKFATWLYGN